MTWRFGVIVPAYRGEDVLQRSLTSLASQRFDEQLRPDDVEVVIAVNDGSTKTQEAARRLAPSVRAAGIRCRIVSSPPGRAKAFAAAESTLANGPRLYLDQDAVLSPNALRELAAALMPGTGTMFATLRPLVAPARSLITRAYYRTWLELSYVRKAPASAGAYAVSEAGRARWTSWPTLHSDDKFVRLQFELAERRRLETASYEVVAPEGFRALVRARRRYFRGNAELAERNPERPDISRRAGILNYVRRPALWPQVLGFLVVYASAGIAECWDRRIRVSKSADAAA
jgi:glycosyltransferase involved in cell wall biosynthesis